MTDNEECQLNDDDGRQWAMTDKRELHTMEMTDNWDKNHWEIINNGK